MYELTEMTDLSDVKSTALTSGWYYLSKNKVMTERMEIKGDVNLILSEGCTLTTQRGIHNVKRKYADSLGAERRSRKIIQ